MARGKAKQPGNSPLSPGAGQGEGLRLAGAVAAIALGTALCAASGQSMLGSRIASGALASHGFMNRLDGWLGADPSAAVSGGEPALPPYGSLFLIVGVVSVVSWLAGAAWIARRQHLSFAAAAASWGLRGWLWWLVGGSWELARLFTFAAGSEGMQQFVLSGPSFWIAAGVAGWVATFFALASGRVDTGTPAVIGAGSRSETAVGAAGRSGLPVTAPDGYRVPPAVWLCFAAYVVVFVAMNWQLYRSLRLPHGDSAMYEEHLWNLLHGKGFRSYLDQGIFLGEHVQVIHVLLVPLYLLWPSQLLLELCDSLLLAACCFPVYWMARRRSGMSRPAVWLAAACLLYFPLQFLDIGIDWKTFRPNGLGIPVLLFALDQLERRRYKTFCLLAAVALGAGRLCNSAGSAWSLDRADAGTPPTITLARQRRPTKSDSSGRGSRGGVAHQLACFHFRGWAGGRFGRVPDRGHAGRNGLLSAWAGNSLRWLLHPLRQDAARDRPHDADAAGPAVGSLWQRPLGRVRPAAARAARLFAPVVSGPTGRGVAPVSHALPERSDRLALPSRSRGRRADPALVSCGRPGGCYASRD